jgi:hypothetical protein
MTNTTKTARAVAFKAKRSAERSAWLAFDAAGRTDAAREVYIAALEAADAAYRAAKEVR